MKNNGSYLLSLDSARASCFHENAHNFFIAKKRNMNKQLFSCIFLLPLVAIVSAKDETEVLRVSYSDDSANTTLNWFNLEIYPTPMSISGDTAKLIIDTTIKVLDPEFSEIYYNFKKFKFDNPLNTPISRTRERNLTQDMDLIRDKSESLQNAASRDSSTDSDIALNDNTRYLQDILDLELGSAVTFSGASVFFSQPVQAQRRVDHEIISTANSPTVNIKLIDAFLSTGDPALSTVYYVRAVPFPSEAPSLTPSQAPSVSYVPSSFPSQFPSLSLSPSVVPSARPVVTLKADSVTTGDRLSSTGNNQKRSSLLFPPIAIAAVFFVIAGVCIRKMKKKTDDDSEGENENDSTDVGSSSSLCESNVNNV